MNTTTTIKTGMTITTEKDPHNAGETRNVLTLTWTRNLYNAYNQKNSNPYSYRHEIKLISEVDTSVPAPTEYNPQAMKRSGTRTFQATFPEISEGKYYGLSTDILDDVCYQIVTPENAAFVWKQVKSLNDLTKSPLYKKYTNILSCLIQNLSKGGNSFYNNDVWATTLNLSGYGYMGGTGCGKLIHHLHYNRLDGVSSKATGILREIAQARFDQMREAVETIHQENKHLREGIEKKALVITFDAHPTCQATVRYHSAYGYPVGSATQETVGCTKCAKKLGITANAQQRKNAGAGKSSWVAPASVEYKGFKINFAKDGRKMCGYLTMADGSDSSKIMSYTESWVRPYRGTESNVLEFSKSHIDQILARAAKIGTVKK